MSAHCAADASPIVPPIPRKRRRKRYKASVRSVADLDRRTTAARNAAKLIERLRADLGGDLTAASVQ